MTADPIQTIEEAKAALDSEIATAEAMVRYYERNEREATEARSRYSSTLYTLRDLRKRMDPPEAPALQVVQQDAA